MVQIIHADELRPYIPCRSAPDGCPPYAEKKPALAAEFQSAKKTGRVKRAITAIGNAAGVLVRKITHTQNR